MGFLVFFYGILWVLLLWFLLNHWFIPMKKMGLLWIILFSAIQFNGLFRGKIYGSYDALIQFHIIREGKPLNPSLSDIALQLTPLYLIVREAYGKGELPLWNPYSGAGYSLWGNPQAMVVHPFVFLSFLLPPAYAMAFIALLRFSFSFVFAWFMGTVFGWEEKVSLIVSSAWIFASPNIHFLYFPLLNEVMLLPGIIGSLHLLFSKHRKKDFFLFVSLILFLLIGGHPTTMVFILLFLFIYFLVFFWRKKGWLTFFFGLFLAFSLASPLLIPQSIAVNQSLRRKALEIEAKRSSNRLAFKSWYRRLSRCQFLLTLPFPGLWGNPRTQERPQGIDFYQHDGTSSGIIFLLIFLGSLSLWKQMKKPARFFLIVGLIATAQSYKLPIITDVMEHLPLLKLTSPQRMRFLIVFSFIMLFGIIAKQKHFIKKTLIFGMIFFFFLFFIAFLRWQLNGDIYPWRLLPPVVVIIILSGWLIVKKTVHFYLLMFLTLSEMLIFTWDFNPSCPASFFYPPFKGVEKIVPPPFRLAGFHSAFQANLPVPYGFWSITENDPMIPAQYVHFLISTNSYNLQSYFHRLAPTRYTPQFLSFMNVKTVITPYPMRSPYLKLKYKDHPFYIYDFTQPIGNLFFSAHRFIVEEKNDFLKTREKVFKLPDPVIVKSYPPNLTPGKPLGKAHIQITQLTNHSYLINAINKDWALIASSLWQDGGWKIKDTKGNAFTNARVFHHFVGFFLPPGKHTLKIVYHPPGMITGVVLFFMGLLGLIMATFCHKP